VIVHLASLFGWTIDEILDLSVEEIELIFESLPKESDGNTIDLRDGQSALERLKAVGIPVKEM